MRKGHQPVTTKTILISGATDGIGRQTARDLAGMGHHVLLHGRDPKRVLATLDEIQRITQQPPPAAYVADFTDLAQVRHQAVEVKAKH